MINNDFQRLENESDTVPSVDYAQTREEDTI